MNSKKGRALALGFFDGVHKGHAALINRTIEVAREKGLSPAVLTFDKHPEQIITGNPVPLISSNRDRERIIMRYFDVDDVLFFHFDDKLMHLKWDRFVERLVSDMSAEHLVVGHDFHFGYKGEGTPEKLCDICARLGIGCDVIPKVVSGDGVTVSSTYIRKLISEGDIRRANEFLGHPHMMTDTVRYGYRFGSTIGFPTINMRFEDGVIVPPRGVYATRVHFRGEEHTEYPAVTNVGVRPTVAEGTEITVETFLFDFDGDLYGKHAILDFYEFIRPEKKFEDSAKLKEQIARDCQAAREFFEK